jgi:pantoate--beta-alanine ligase
MKTVTTVAELQDILQKSKIGKRGLGFVPTMGALHAGHLSLIEKAKKKNEIVVCSIFVNPTQFNNKTDLAKYPRTLEKDGKMLKKAGCHILFAPSVEEIYPKGLNTNVKISFNGLDKVMEGKFRPGHFAGMAQVVNRLLQIVNPDHLYMGQKDFQQFTIVAHMIKKLKYATTLVVCPILREPHGLAMSSRNERLTKDLRDRAAIIYKTLQWAKRNVHKLSIKELEKLALEKMTIPDFKPEYFSFIDGHTLKAVKEIDKHEYVVICVAVWAGEVRLIDNLRVVG